MIWVEPNGEDSRFPLIIINEWQIAESTRLLNDAQSRDDKVSSWFPLSFSVFLSQLAEY